MLGRMARGRAIQPPGRDHGPDQALQRIHATVDSIPRGRVATYGQVAEQAGLPRRARLVGRVLGELPAGSELPWHRVVNAAGRISARSDDGGSERAQALRLREEGVEVSSGLRVDLKRYRWET